MRRRLSSFRSDAYASGNAADGRAAKAVIDAFDNEVDRTINGGLFSGNRSAVKYEPTTREPSACGPLCLLQGSPYNVDRRAGLSSRSHTLTCQRSPRYTVSLGGLSVEAARLELSSEEVGQFFHARML